jgi:hypothetical protein
MVDMIVFLALEIELCEAGVGFRKMVAKPLTILTLYVNAIHEGIIPVSVKWNFRQEPYHVSYIRREQFTRSCRMMIYICKTKRKLWKASLEYEYPLTLVEIEVQMTLSLNARIDHLI